MTRCHGFPTLALAAAAVLAPRPAEAQRDCKMLFCAPALTFSPGVRVADLIDPPRVQDPPPGAPERELPRAAVFILGLDLFVPMALPRLSGLARFRWAPTGGGGENAPVLELGGSATVLQRESTGGWLGASVNALDRFSPAARRSDARAYTHKLDLELDLVIGLLGWLPEDLWLRHITAYATLDYLATGRARAGDPVPGEVGVYLDDASPWSLRAGLRIPVAPIVPPPPARPPP